MRDNELRAAAENLLISTDLVERLAKIIDPEAFGLPYKTEPGTLPDRDVARDRARMVLTELMQR